MNKYIKEITPNGFTEILEYNGVKYIKRYERTHLGYQGLDVAWEYEDSLPEHVIEALEFGDELDIMNALNEDENDIYEEELQ
jgi:hypothetical protein